MRSVWRRAGQTVLTVLLLALPTAALAQNADPSCTSLSVAQPRVQTTLNPGEAVDSELRFTYDGPLASNGRLSVVEYHLGADGSRIQSPPEGAPNSAARWISLDIQSLMLQPGGTVPVHFRIEVPPGTAAGD